MPNLQFPMQRQQMTQWCWAAVTSSTTVFFQNDRQWLQCELAAQALRLPSCCSGPPPACDQQFMLDRALSAVQNLNRIVGPPGSLAALAAEIDAGRPVAARIQWRRGGAGHFIVVEGYDPARNLCFVRDSLFGPSVSTFDVVRLNYLNEGFWTHTFLLRGRLT